MKILIIEYNRDLLHSLTNYLSNNNYEVDETFDSTIGLQMILNNQYDLVLLDNNMLRIKAKDIVMNALSHNVNTPFIAISNKMNMHANLLINNELFNDYLLLPFSNQELIKKINKTIEFKNNKKDIIYNDLKLVLNEFKLYKDNNHILLTTNEMLVLIELFNNQGDIDNLMKIFNENDYNSDILYFYIKSLNTKLKKLNDKYNIKYQNLKYEIEVIVNGKEA